MKIFSCFGLLASLVILTACSQPQENRQSDSIRASVRRQDSIGAKDRLDRLNRQIRESGKSVPEIREEDPALQK